MEMLLEKFVQQCGVSKVTGQPILHGVVPPGGVEYTPKMVEAFKEATTREYTLDSNLLINVESTINTPRLLTTDQPLLLPFRVPVRMIITSADVIHS